jgi:hypothetical protein
MLRIVTHSTAPYDPAGTGEAAMRYAAFRLASAALAFVLGISEQARAQAQVDWTVEKAPDRCSLRREGNVPAAEFMMLSSSPGGDVSSLLVGVEKPTLGQSGPNPVELALEGPGKSIKRWGNLGYMTDRPIYAVRIPVDAKDIALLSHASAFRLKYQGKTVGPYPLPDMAGALAALRDCLNEHMLAMGANPQELASGGSPPVLVKTDFAQSLTFDIFRAAGGRLDADSYYKVEIDERGMVTSCAQFGAVQPPKIEKLVCELVAMKRPYHPAHDPSGNPVNGLAIYRFPAMHIVFVP